MILPVIHSWYSLWATADIAIITFCIIGLHTMEIKYTFTNIGVFRSCPLFSLIYTFNALLATLLRWGHSFFCIYPTYIDLKRWSSAHFLQRITFFWCWLKASLASFLVNLWYRFVTGVQILLPEYRLNVKIIINVGETKLHFTMFFSKLVRLMKPV